MSHSSFNESPTAKSWFLRFAVGLVKLAGVILAAFVSAVLAAIGFVFYQGKRKPKGNSQYVAMGSSFAAAPGIGKRDPDSPYLCMRSSENYAHLLAKDLGLDLTDVTSSGATTKHVLEGGQFFQPAQLDALRPSTELVTITIGGNDIAYVGNLIAWSARNVPERTPWLYRKMAPVPDSTVDQEMALLPGRLTQIAEEVKRRSPRATLVFVDYSTILPDTDPCWYRLPLTPEQMERGRYIAAKLAEITAGVARTTGAVLVRASELSCGHDVCSEDPWVEGLIFSPMLFNFGPTAYHLNEKAMRAITDAIKAAIS